jgi:hypothetical protein
MSKDRPRSNEANKSAQPSKKSSPDISLLASLVSIIGFALALAFSGLPLLRALLFVVVLTLVLSAALVLYGGRSKLVFVSASVLVLLAVVSLGIADWLNSETSEGVGEVSTADVEKSATVPPTATTIDNVEALAVCGSGKGMVRLVYETAGRNPIVYLEREDGQGEFGGTDPDARGRHLVYLEIARRQVVVVDVETEKVIATRTFESEVSSPTITRDGSAVLLVSEDDTGSSLLMWETSGGRVSTIYDPSGPVSNPAISDDGRWAAWVEGRSTSAHVVVSEVTGNRFQELTSWPGSDPSWSPDGSAVAFVAPHNDGFAIFSRLLAEGSVTRISNPAGAVDSAPAWSPFCDFLGFIRSVGPNSAIWIADGEDESVFKELGGVQSHPAFAYLPSDLDQ